MANYQLLKADIDAKVYQNGQQEITGANLNSVLNEMVTTLGAEYQFAGVATIDTNPGTPDAKVFYIANGKGTYTNFGRLEVTEDEVVVLYYDTEWHKVATGIASQAKLTELESTIRGIDTLVEITSDNTRESYRFDESLNYIYDVATFRATKIDVSTFVDAEIDFYAYTNCGFILENGDVVLHVYGDSEIKNKQTLKVPINAKYMCISWAPNFHEQELHIKLDGIKEDLIKQAAYIKENTQDIEELNRIVLDSVYHVDVTDDNTKVGYGFTEFLEYELKTNFSATKIEVSNYGGDTIKFYGYNYCGFVTENGEKIISFYNDDTIYKELSLAIPLDAKYFCISWVKNFHDQDINIIHVGDINNRIKDVDAEEVINIKPIADGFVLANSEVANSEGYKVTDYIDIRRFQGSNIKIKSTIYGAASTCLYDEHRNLIVGIDGNNAAEFGITADQNIFEYSLEIPNNAYYIRLSAISAYYSEGSIYIKGKRNVASYDITDLNVNSLLISKNNLLGDKVLIIGDSISTDNTSERFFAKHKDVFPDWALYENYGGYRKWVEDLIRDGFLPYDTDNCSIHATGFVARYRAASITDEDNTFLSRLQRITNKESYDIVIVFGGINDWIQSIPREDFQNAVESFYDYLVTNFVSARIIIATPLQAYDTGNGFGSGANLQGLTQTEYADMIKEVARKYTIPVLDLSVMGGFSVHNKSFRDVWSLAPGGGTSHDGVHPTKEWCEKFLSTLFKRFIINHI